MVVCEEQLLLALDVVVIKDLLPDLASRSPCALIAFYRQEILNGRPVRSGNEQDASFSLLRVAHLRAPADFQPYYARPCPAIFSHSWPQHRARKILGPPQRSYVEPNPPHLLSGTLYCGACAGTIGQVSGKGSGYYGCLAAVRGLQQIARLPKDHRESGPDGGEGAAPGSGVDPVRPRAGRSGGETPLRRSPRGDPDQTRSTNGRGAADCQLHRVHR